MGRELRRRGVRIADTIWSASALLDAPETVRQVHADFIAAGADVIITNTYGVIRHELAREGVEDRFADLNRLACELAARACAEAGRQVLIAGALPPLRGSYRPDLVGPYDEIEPLYAEQAALLAPHVDLLICETMSSAAEGLAAASAACKTGKPVWLSWTLHEDRSGRLRSGERVAAAHRALDDLPVQAFLVNCCAPESISVALPELVALAAGPVGGYANAFAPVPDDWTLDGSGPTNGLLDLRGDMTPEVYAGFAQAWLDAGARLIGGCCGIGPEHIAKLGELIEVNA
jgi:S-methylmethionine-dependent homocysteine/selenocysteine methylase